MSGDPSDAETRALPSSRQALLRYRNPARDSPEGLLSNRTWKMGSSDTPRELQTGRHLRNRHLGRPQGPPPICFEAEHSLRASAALRRRLAYRGADIAFGFEPLKRRVDRAYGNIAAGTLLDLAPNRHSVRIRPKVHQRKQHHVLQRANQVTTRHMLYSVEQMAKFSNVQHSDRRVSSDNYLVPHRRYKPLPMCAV